MTHKILLDTDIGSDIDDAIALAYLLAQPQCELLGITTVTGEPVKRAMMASAQCKVAGKTIPIYPGAAEPLIIAQRQPQAPQAAKLDRWDHDTDFPKGEAVEFLRHTIRANPGEITLFAIGPLTNIALLFHSDPEIPSLLKELVLMCGVFAGVNWQAEPLEWNAILDPHATAMVYRAQPPLHRSVGLDVTTKVVMARDAVRQRFQTPYLQPVFDFADVWFEQRPEITFHDPLAATLLFDDSICSYTMGAVTVELEDKTRLGQTKWTPGAGPHSVALGVDAAKFFDHYFAVFEPPTP
jgi:inosine-uridine nucleoside N-ribohydrolase